MSQSQSASTNQATFINPMFRYGMPLGLLLMGLGGGFVPWVWHKAVVLQITAPGLAEFVKFLPEVRTAQLSPERLYFLGPLFVAMLLLPLSLDQAELRLPIWVRWGLRLMVIPLALASLSPVWTPEILTDDEFRLQTIFACVALTFIAIGSFINRYIPVIAMTIVLALSGFVSLSLAWQVFTMIRPSVGAVYGQTTVTPGPGWWLALGGYLVSIGCGFMVSWRQRGSANGVGGFTQTFKKSFDS